MNSYQVVGEFVGRGAKPICWGGKTSLRDRAVERLAEADKYAAQRIAVGGQQIKWEIKETMRKTCGT